MADIIITCNACGNPISVSEFVSAEFLTCRKCKANVPVPKQMPAGPARPKPGCRVEEPPPPPTQPPAPPPRKRGLFGSRAPRKTHPPGPLNNTETVIASMPKIRKRVRRKHYSSWANKFVPWILFVTLTLVFCYLRWIPGAMPSARLTMLIQGAVGALLFIHVSVVLFAFSEDSFHAILCAIIPGYSLYYLFSQLDQYIIRALTAALLIAFGLDTGQAIQSTWRSFYRTTNAWLQDSHMEK
jgi:hypothetical protein